VLVHRGREGLPIAPPNRTPAELLARAAVQMTIGGLLLAWAMRADFRDSSFWLEHGVKLVAVYLIGFDGAFLMLEGLVRALGVAIIDQTRDPALATTPANFWRRYNREAGRLLYADVFRPIGGLRYPRAAIVVTFLINGVLHEYLAWILIGSVQGYQMAFFALHGLATALTFELRPRGTLGRAVGMAITLLFVYVTSVLFFASVSQFFPWYARGPLRPW
jgi:D-alanyl-lipoteichoic acid acyltransferase DltB (MBOAT superfamily)